MSVTLDDTIEFMITRRLSIEQCYMEIMLWPETMQDEGKKILHEKMKEGRFDKAITYHHTTFINPKEPKQIPLGALQFIPIKLPWYKRIFNFKK